MSDKKAIKVEGVISFARFIDRPNRFLVNVRLEESNKVNSAFLHDPGRMKELLTPNVQLMLRQPLRKGNRKTDWDVLAVFHKGSWITINSALPNLVAKTALTNGWIPELSKYKTIKPEVKYGNSRLDFLLTNGNDVCYVEVKGVTLVEGTYALFPDAPTSRGTRHLQELIKIKASGKRAVVLFITMRNDPEHFSPNWRTDPIFSKQLEQAKKHKVEILIYKVKPILLNSKLELHFTRRLNLILKQEHKIH